MEKIAFNLHSTMFIAQNTNEAKQTTETNNLNRTTYCQESQQRIWTRGYFETSSGSGQSQTWARDLWIVSPTHWPLKILLTEPQ